jgi:hypothetical protein
MRTEMVPPIKHTTRRDCEKSGVGLYCMSAASKACQHLVSTRHTGTVKRVGEDAVKRKRLSSLASLLSLSSTPKRADARRNSGYILESGPALYLDASYHKC